MVLATVLMVCSSLREAGLGLTLVKKYVEMHGGDIWLESEVDKGSTFTLQYPRVCNS
jgi:signal transduction histidine kinase